MNWGPSDNTDAMRTAYEAIHNAANGPGITWTPKKSGPTSKASQYPTKDRAHLFILDGSKTADTFIGEDGILRHVPNRRFPKDLAYAIRGISEGFNDDTPATPS